jgi:hypothetical protein
VDYRAKSTRLGEAEPRRMKYNIIRAKKSLNDCEIAQNSHPAGGVFLSVFGDILENNNIN